MDLNDRSTASTIMSNMPGASMREYSGLNRRGFAMEGLASYEDYDKANAFSKIAILIKDVADASTKITNRWSYPERLTMKSVTSELNKMGYPAESIKGVLDTASLLLPAKIRNRLYAKEKPVSTGGGSGPSRRTPPSGGEKGGYGMWIGLAAAGALAVFMLKKRGA
mgnify:CR=1 FL=1